MQSGFPLGRKRPQSLTPVSATATENTQQLLASFVRPKPGQAHCLVILTRNPPRLKCLDWCGQNKKSLNFETTVAGWRCMVLMSRTSCQEKWNRFHVQALDSHSQGVNDRRWRSSSLLHVCRHMPVRVVAGVQSFPDPEADLCLCQQRRLHMAVSPHKNPQQVRAGTLTGLFDPEVVVFFSRWEINRQHDKFIFYTFQKSKKKSPQMNKQLVEGSELCSALLLTLLTFDAT